MTPRILVSIGGGNGASYLAALQAAGGRGTARYCPAPDLSFDGLLLAGGDDIDPAQFGQANHGSRGIDPARDGAELALLTDTAQDGWYQVSYNGGTGYVAAEFVKVIDVTVERYNALKSSASATPTPEPSGEPGAGATPTPTGTGSQAGNNASSDNEDGE